MSLHSQRFNESLPKHRGIGAPLHEGPSVDPIRRTSLNDMIPPRQAILVVVSPSSYRTFHNSARSFAECLMRTCDLEPLKIDYIESKFNGDLYLFGLTDQSSHQFRQDFMRHFHPCRMTEIPCVDPRSHIIDSDYVFSLLVERGVDSMTFEELARVLSERSKIWPVTLNVSSNLMVEENTEDFQGVRRIRKCQKIDRDLRLITISIRTLAPLVRKMVPKERIFDERFLDEMQDEIRESRAVDRIPPICIVTGEGDAKPLEHLISCVPGIEVIWRENKKMIRPLVVGERQQDIDDTYQRSLMEELAKTHDLYMKIADLARSVSPRKSVDEVRDLLQKHTMRFQIIGENKNEYVTLSHRNQMKRLCNGISRTLKERPSKYLTKAELIREFENRKDGQSRSAHFSVSEFNVCYLDDLLVTIPQNWSIHCREYLTTEGTIMIRGRGSGPEDIPSYVDWKDSSIVIWKAPVQISDFCFKNRAFFREQLLNMFCGDLNRCRESKAIFEKCSEIFDEGMSFQDLQRCYNEYYQTQLVKKAYGVDATIDLLDSLQGAVVLSSRNTQDTKIRLTTVGRELVIERRIIHLLTKFGFSSRSTLYDLYRRFFVYGEFQEDESHREEFLEILQSSSMIDRRFISRDIIEYSAREVMIPTGNWDWFFLNPVFCHLMKSFEALDLQQLKREYDRYNLPRHIIGVLGDLIDHGIVRKSSGIDGESLYDLHHTFRMIRNLVNQMNDFPDQTYPLSDNHRSSSPNTHESKITMADFLRFSGDHLPSGDCQLRCILQDFHYFFQEIISEGKVTYKLTARARNGVPESPEDLEIALTQATRTWTNLNGQRGMIPRSRKRRAAQ